MNGDNYVIALDENGSPYLAHYGVLGMKWGVRHNPEKAYTKASKKLKALSKASDKALNKAGYYNSKANRRKIGSNKREAELARRAYSRSIRHSRKASKWIKAMKKEFSKQDVVSLDPELISLGDSMTERYRMLRVGGIRA